MASEGAFRFEQICRQIQLEIQSGKIPSGSLLKSERELQQVYDASRTTIRRALAELVASGWAENKPNRGVIARKGKTTAKSSRVAFVDHRDHVHKTLFFKLHTHLAAMGMDLIHIDSQEIGTMEGLNKAVADGCAAAFVWPKVSHIDSKQLAAVQAEIPVIAVDHSIGGEPSDIVMSDHMAGAKLVVDQFVGLGRRRIAITGYFTNMEDAQLRFNGYLLGLYDHDIPADASNFVFSSPQAEAYEDPRLLRFRLNEEDRPDAVFVLHDMSAPAIVDTILDAGLRVPEDVAVIGFGNDLPFNVDRVGLSTVSMNWEAVADALLTRMEARLADPTAPFSRTLVPVKLIVRGSCGAPAADWSTEGYEISSVTTTLRMRPSALRVKKPSYPKEALSQER